MADTQRLFFALWPDQQLQQTMAACLPPVATGGRLIPTANLHATLVFLGGVESLRVGRLTDLARGIEEQGFTLTLTVVEVWNRALVVLVPLTIPDELARLVGRLNCELEQAGFLLDTRPYRPHVTVIREKRRGAGRRQGLIEGGAEARCPVAPIEWRVQDFVLARSHTAPEGSRYEVLQRWALQT